MPAEPPGGRATPVPDGESLLGASVLGPSERITEILCGVVMTLTFTGSVSVASPDLHDPHALAIAALGCNLAWGIVDGMLYVIGRAVDRARRVRWLRELHAAPTLAAFEEVLREEVPERLVLSLPLGATRHLRDRIRRTGTAPAPALSVPARDWKGALLIGCLVFLSTFPPVLPLLLIPEPRVGLRVSHLVAMAMLFLAGWNLARHTGGSRLRVGLVMTALGGVLAGVCLLLGG